MDRRNNDQEAEGVLMSTAMSACAKRLEAETCRESSMLSVPCHVNDPDLWFAENPIDLERAKALCADCPIRRECLAAGLEREEPWGTATQRQRGEPGGRLAAGFFPRQAASSANPGISSVASALTGMCASS